MASKAKYMRAWPIYLCAKSIIFLCKPIIMRIGANKCIWEINSLHVEKDNLIAGNLYSTKVIKPFPIMTNGFLAAWRAATACLTAHGSASKRGGAGHLGTNLKYKDTNVVRYQHNVHRSMFLHNISKALIPFYMVFVECKEYKHVT